VQSYCHFTLRFQGNCAKRDNMRMQASNTFDTFVMKKVLQTECYLLELFLGVKKMGISVIISRGSGKKDGYSLFVSMVFIMLVSIYASIIMTAAEGHTKRATKLILLEQASSLAEAAVETGAQLIANSNGLLGDSTPIPAEKFGKGWFAGEIVRIAANEQQFEIHTTGTVSFAGTQIQRGIFVDRASPPNVAECAFCTEDNNGVYFTYGNVFDGWVHSNTALSFDSSAAYGGAVFNGEVTSASSGAYNGDMDWVVFDQGYDFNAPSIDLSYIEYSHLEFAASDSGTELEGATSIAINGDSMFITNDRAGWTNHMVSLTAEHVIHVVDASDGLPGENGIVDLGAIILDGELTIVASDDIRVNDHIIYLNDPRDDELPEVSRDYLDPSTDKLGLISKDDVVITSSAPNNLEVFGSFLATGDATASAGDDASVVLDKSVGKFFVEGYDDLARGDRGILTLFGGVTQEVRGEMGLFSGAVNYSGYKESILFDKRFSGEPPPFFPPLSWAKVTFKDWAEFDL